MPDKTNSLSNEPAAEELSAGKAESESSEEREGAGPGIRIGVLAGEPIRLAGLSTVFDEAPECGKPPLVPVVGALTELIADPKLLYMVVDFNSSDCISSSVACSWRCACCDSISTACSCRC